MTSLRAGVPSAVLVAVLSLVGAAPAGTDPLRPQQYGLESSGLAAATEAGARADGVVVAVLDTGVDLDHPDLAGALVPGRDFVDGDTRPDDENGHGTHVAGVIAAGTGNGIGIAGGAPGAKIMPVRVLDADGTGDADVIADAVRWAAGHGADVINLSLDDTGPADRLRKDGPLSRALRDVAGRVVVVAAAGNEDQAERVYRAGVPALVVQAVGPDGHPAEFSDFGDPRSVAAPGVDILSTVPGGYARKSGTSMAAPHVAAEAALLLGRGADPATVREVIADTAHPTDDPRLGAGLIDAQAALAVLASPDPSGDPPTTPAPTAGSDAAGTGGTDPAGSEGDPTAGSDAAGPVDSGGADTVGTGGADAVGSGGAALLGLSLVGVAGLLTALTVFLRRTRRQPQPRSRPRRHP
ncbi:S8 family serine peptidase [Streptomyces sp. NPDC057257]|uniref:S8 family serine peptidase n=1 Tax=Streptomyces sp. NPDC057257 TaxID=3346071 RepID=UPI003635EEFD